MVLSIYKKALAVIAKKPFRLWGLSLLEGVLSIVISVLFGIIPGVSAALNLAISTSMTLIFLRGYRGETPKAVQLFDALKDWQTAKRVILGMAWASLWIFLWSLIPIVGFIFGIIKGYQYRLVPYILVLEPDVPLTEAINVSKERTEGYKGKMFGADILIFVIYLLAFIVLGLLAKIQYIGILFSIIAALFLICVIVFHALFMGLVRSAFYEEIMQKTTTI